MAEEGEDPRLNNLRKRNPPPTNSVIKSTNLFSLNNEKAEEKTQNNENALNGQSLQGLFNEGNQGNQEKNGKSNKKIIHTQNNPYPNGGINEYKEYQLTTPTIGEGKLPKNVVDVAEGKNELPQGTTNEQIRALEEQSKEQETKNKQLLNNLQKQVNEENAKNPEQQLDELLEQKPNGNALNEGSQTSQKAPRRIRNERNEYNKQRQKIANQGIEARNRMTAIEEMERQRQERIKASRQNKNKFKFNKPENQKIYNEGITRNRSNSIEKLNGFTPVKNGEYQGENLENIQKLLYGTPVTGGKNKRKYNKRKLKTKIDKIPKKYILRL